MRPRLLAASPSKVRLDINACSNSEIAPRIWKNIRPTAVEESTPWSGSVMCSGPNPGGWIMPTARRRAIDRLRREATRTDRHAQAALLHLCDDEPEKGPVQDDRLRLIFTCCHPALSTEAQIALTLRLLGGLHSSGTCATTSRRRDPCRTTGCG